MCDRAPQTEFADGLRDGVTGLLYRRGIDYGPVGHNMSWLWCLGGPDLYRRPLPGDSEEYLDADNCVDLNISVCARHRIFTASLYPYDLVSESTADHQPHRRSSTPIPLADEPDAAATLFLTRLEEWLDHILILPTPV